MDKFNPIDMSLWQGRQDPEDGELALRWHDKVLPWTAGAQDCCRCSAARFCLR